MANPYGQIAMQGGVDMVYGILNNYYARQREQEARRENYEYGEKSAENADRRTRALYNDFYSPEALMRQYEEAGLSPSLMFGGSGAGLGATPNGAQGTGANGIGPNTFGINPLQIAQIDLLKSESRKNEAEANRIEGKNERGKGEIDQIYENIKKTAEESHNIGLKSALYEYEAALDSLKLSYEESTLDNKINYFLNECKYLEHKVRKAKVEGNVAEQTEADTIKMVNMQLKQVAADILLKKMQTAVEGKNIELKDVQISDLVNQITTRSEQIKLNKDTFKQDVREWATKNGIITDKNASYWELIEKKLFSEHTEELIIRLIEALAH